MPTPNFTLRRERLLSLRARLQGDVTQMASNAQENDGITFDLPVPGPVVVESNSQFMSTPSR